MSTKSFIYTLKQDTSNTDIWYFDLYPSKSSTCAILRIKVNALNGRFTIRKSANLNLKIVGDSIAKLLEFLRLSYSNDEN